MKLSFSNYLVLLFGAVTGLVTDLQERGDYDFVKPVTVSLHNVPIEPMEQGHLILCRPLR